MYKKLQVTVFKSEPLSNYDIKEVESVFARNRLSKPLVSGYNVINMRDCVGVGTYWPTIYVRVNTSIWYFDYLAWNLPQEIVVVGLPFVYNSSQYLSLKSVLCGFYCYHNLQRNVAFLHVASHVRPRNAPSLQLILFVMSWHITFAPLDIPAWNLWSCTATPVWTGLI